VLNMEISGKGQEDFTYPWLPKGNSILGIFFLIKLNYFKSIH